MTILIGCISVNLDESVVNTMIYSCFDNVAAGTCDTRSNFDVTLNDVNMCCDGNFEMINYRIFGSSSDPCLSCKSYTSMQGEPY